MTYTIEREDAAEDARVLRAAIRVASGFVPEGAEAMQRLAELADSIAEQVKPAVEEPTEFGSLVAAWGPRDPKGVAADTWQMSPQDGKHYWQTRSGKVEVWSELIRPEVLRVGIGEDRDVAPEETSDYMYGVQDTKSALRRRLTQFASTAITAELKDAFQKALEALEAIS